MFKCSWLNFYSLTDPMPKGFLTCSLSKSTGFLGLCLTVPAVDSLLQGAETAQWLYLIEKKTHSLAGQLQRERARGSCMQVASVPTIPFTGGSWVNKCQILATSPIR